MNKKIMVIAGSPRKGGNSDLLCDELIRGADESGNITEKIYLNDLHILPCQACYGCRSTGKCVQKDDMANLSAKMIAADVIVLATPVYFYSMSGQMKTMIDRTLPCYTAIKNKDFYLIATAAAGAESMERAIESLRGFTDCLPGSRVRGVIYGAGVYLKGEVLKTTAMQEAFNAGKSI